MILRLNSTLLKILCVDFQCNFIFEDPALNGGDSSSLLWKGTTLIRTPSGTSKGRPLKNTRAMGFNKCLSNTDKPYGNIPSLLCRMSADLSALPREGICRHNKRYCFIKLAFLFLESELCLIPLLLENTARIFSRNVYFGRQRKFGRIIYDTKTGTEFFSPYCYEATYGKALWE
jgi:hypothetical protein